MADFPCSTEDGWIRGSAFADYETAHSIADEHYTTSAYIAVGQWAHGLDYSVVRGVLKFNTSSIPDTANITQVNLTLFAISLWSPGVDFDIVIKKHNWGSNPIDQYNRNAIFNACLVADSDDNILGNTSEIDEEFGGYLTSGNLYTAWINKKGITCYSLISARDINATVPDGDEWVTFVSQENETSSLRPVLTVAYSLPNSIYGKVLMTMG